MKDLFGTALLDYQNGNYTDDIITWTTISDEDLLPLPYLFRSFSEMPLLEQKALQLVKGNVLDIGCGAGSHALWLQNNGVNVTAIDSSKGAIEVSKKRGVSKTVLKPLLEYHVNTSEKFDTILLLMNGTGIFETLNKVSRYLKHLKTLLNPNGQILIDSSDIAYMFDKSPKITTKDDNYYGELDYYIAYKDKKELPIKWLYLDFKTLKNVCEAEGLTCKKIKDGLHFDYLAKIF